MDREIIKKKLPGSEATAPQETPPSAAIARVVRALDELGISDLYDLKASTAASVGEALGLSLHGTNNAAVVARALVEQGFLSPEIPLERPVKRGFGGFYLDAAVVGAERVLLNVKRWVRHQQTKDPEKARSYRHLDEVEQNLPIGAALGLGKNEHHLTSSLGRKLVEVGLISPEIPPGHPISRRRGSAYLNPDIVGPAQVIDNIVRWIRHEQTKEPRDERRMTNLDHIPPNGAMGTALGLSHLDSRKGAAVGRKLIEYGLLSADIPEGHPLTQSRGSLYLNPEVVGAAAARENLRCVLQERYNFTVDIQRSDVGFVSFCRALNVEISPRALREMVRLLGWLPDAEPQSIFQPVPALFRRSSAGAAAGRAKRELPEIDESLERTGERAVRFLKGEAFEQLVGLALAAIEPEAPLLSQYCLDVSPSSGYYGVRVDWRIGAKLIEVKWGRALENVRDTAAKHRKFLEKNGWSDVHYDVVTFVECADSSIGTTSFDALLRSVPEELRENFQKIGAMLARDEYSSDAGASERCRLIRDTLYTTAEKLSALTGAARRGEIETVLRCIVGADSDRLAEILKAGAPRAFNGLAATFAYGGQLYRGQITLPTYLSEDDHRALFRSVYTFGDLRFYDRIDRDIAVLIEYHCNDRIEAFVPAEQSFGRGVVFQLPGGVLLQQANSRSEAGALAINDLDGCAELLGVSPEDLAFVKEYVSRRGGAA